LPTRIAWLRIAARLGLSNGDCRKLRGAKAEHRPHVVLENEANPAIAKTRIRRRTGPLAELTSTTVTNFISADIITLQCVQRLVPMCRLSFAGTLAACPARLNNAVDDGADRFRMGP
jgi:hypothetical protein